MPIVKQIPLAVDVPWVGAGSVYANAKGLARFVQFFLNRGKVDGQTILDQRLITNMMIPSIRSKNYGLGIEILHINGHYALGHAGSGLGFLSGMYWLPEYEFGIVSLVNSEDVKQSLSGLVTDLIDENLFKKNESFEIPSGEYQAYQPMDPNTFTPFKPEWKKYIGTYKYIMGSAWKLDSSARIALALGLTTSTTHVKVFEEEGYLYVDSKVFHDNDGGRLDEYLPGLFFTPTGKCLDLRGPKLTWQNYRIKKVDNDSDRKFDLNR